MPSKRKHAVTPTRRSKRLTIVTTSRGTQRRYNGWTDTSITSDVWTRIASYTDTADFAQLVRVCSHVRGKMSWTTYKDALMEYTLSPANEEDEWDLRTMIDLSCVCNDSDMARRLMLAQRESENPDSTTPLRFDPCFLDDDFSFRFYVFCALKRHTRVGKDLRAPLGSWIITHFRRSRSLDKYSNRIARLMYAVGQERWLQHYVVMVGDRESVKQHLAAGGYMSDGWGYWIYPSPVIAHMLEWYCDWCEKHPATVTTHHAQSTV